MRPPYVWCDHCGRRRLCSAHMHAEHPPTAAKKWLKQKCTEKPEGCDRLTKPCRLIYRAGVDFGGRAL